MDTFGDVSLNIICKNNNSEYFDTVIGYIEEIVLSDEFECLHTKFLNSNWHKIEDGEENKLEYMDIFNDYANTFESFIVRELSRRMEDFSMEHFAEELRNYEANNDSEYNNDIFELLNSFTSFETFKEIMLDYRNKMEGNTSHLDFDILVVTRAEINPNKVFDMSTECLINQS
ncbi:ADP-ribosylation factor-like protein 2-binding protein [Teleopsis dalmanni]|uniref:ADP-ribosylation factor-like protein 2-binding protein n=1 Tax=Teleopsis dalmanni TaxID=139649 RepID=UPI0018CDF9A6|nr:ADP-ribosylation factor-like protein 2-binding protein [Teleopsis dalmanni]